MALNPHIFSNNPVEQLQKRIPTKIPIPGNNASLCGEVSSLYNLPDNVKEGHSAVHTVDDGESRRSIIELSYLAHPGFLKLLLQAEEEFGFRQKGILAVPYGYGDLQRLLESKESSG